MKKKLGFFNKIIYWINLLVALLLLVSFVLPLVPPKSFPFLSLLSLTVSPLIIINALFVLYWLFKIKIRLILSLSVLLIAHFYFGSFFQFSSEKQISSFNNSLTILSYNVHLFNGYEKNVQPKKVSETLQEILENQQPDIVCIQEYYADNQVDFSKYPYRFIYFKKKNKLGHAIFSKYPLLNKKSFDFKNTYNNSLRAEVVKGVDTLRIYNLHLQSLGVIPRVSYLQEADKEKILKRVTKGFVKQQNQTEIILADKNKSKYPVILCGDFNNTSSSYVYHKISDNMNDAFVEKGNGIGTTYLFDKYPMRIDYIMSSKKLNVVDFETVTNTFSDHYPINATIAW